jgi:chemotaxis signal transduction protein
MTAIRKVVRFRTGDGNFAVAVEHVVEVRNATSLVPLPAAAPGVAGLLRRGDDALTVLTALGAGDGHILVLDVGDGAFGLLVEEVRGIVTVGEQDVDPPPRGQQSETVSGVVRGLDELVLLVDANALARTVAL